MLAGVKTEPVFRRFTSKVKHCPIRVESNVIDTKPIVIKYSNDYQIHILHEQIINRLKSQVDADELKIKLNELIRTPPEDTIIGIKCRKKEIDDLNAMIASYTSGEKLNSYLEETGPIVDEYLSLGQYVEVIDFTEETEVSSHMSNNSYSRLMIIDNYFKILSKYVKVDVYREDTIKDDTCAVCGGKLIGMSYDEANDDKYCIECDSISTQSESLTYNEGVKSHVTSNKYDVLITYKRELKQFQGIEKIDLPKNLYSDLDTHFLSLGFPPGEEIRKRPVDEFGKTEGTSLSALCNALSAIGYSSLYKHANKIGKEYWGWKLHDLEKIMPLLINDFIVIQREFPFVKKKRSSNICSQHRVFHQVRLRNVNVCTSDFKFPGLEALLDSEYIWKQMVERTNLYPYIPTFPIDELNFISEKKGIVVKVGTVTYIHECTEDSDGNVVIKSRKISS